MNWNGAELARCIKSSPVLAATRIVMVTSLSCETEVNPDAHADIDAYLRRPIRRQDLLDAVSNSAAAAPANAVTAFQPAKAESGSKPLAGMRLLVAEDNHVNQFVAEEYVTSMGGECSIVENGRLALEAMASVTFDVVLMDCQMPEMDGFTACRRIREIERAQGLPRTPVIALTATTYDSDQKLCAAAGMDDFVGKPYTSAQLEAVLVRWKRTTSNPRQF
jgi:CheY-like chemotaxis protein